MKLLDGGALGIICPMVNTAEDTKTFVGAMRPMPLRDTGRLGRHALRLWVKLSF